MNARYYELKSKLATNHAVCQTIEAELKTIQPPEVWIRYYDNPNHEPKAFHSEELAKADYPCLTGKIVRYVLPEIETKEQKK